MPKIPLTLLNAIIYIYDTKEDAENNEQSGGTGFLVGVRLEVNRAHVHTYAVTAAHVIKKIKAKHRNPFLRINSESGGFEVLKTVIGNWIPHDDGSDVAVLPIELLSGNPQYDYIEAASFISKEIAQSIGPGDEVFMIGRLVNHEGRKRNWPSVRFGNISMMPWEPLLDEYGIAQESFVVECRSIGGYSGSPVFLFIPSIQTESEWEKGYGSDSRYRVEASTPRLLGLDWCHIQRTSRVLAEGPARRTVPVEPAMFVRDNTGMAGVLPSWKLKELLDQEELAMKRKEDDENITRRKRGGVLGTRLP